MSAAQIIADLRRRGVEIETDGTRLRWRPKSALTPDDRAELTRLKSEILQWLSPAPEKPCRICKGGRYWRHAQHGHWLCRRCHPPSFPDTVAEERGSDPPVCGPADWGTDVEPLVNWFIQEGQHQLPEGPFALTDWIEVTSPERFRESLLFDIACGPDGPRNRYGAVEEELRRVAALLDRTQGNA